jgi:hypothetical protein
VRMSASVGSSGSACSVALHRLMQSERQHQRQRENDSVQSSHTPYFFNVYTRV